MSETTLVLLYSIMNSFCANVIYPFSQLDFISRTFIFFISFLHFCLFHLTQWPGIELLLVYKRSMLLPPLIRKTYMRISIHHNYQEKNQQFY